MVTAVREGYCKAIDDEIKRRNGIGLWTRIAIRLTIACETAVHIRFARHRFPAKLIPKSQDCVVLVWHTVADLRSSLGLAQNSQNKPIYECSPASNNGMNIQTSRMVTSTCYHLTDMLSETQTTFAAGRRRYPEVSHYSGEARGTEVMVALFEDSQ